MKKIPTLFERIYNNHRVVGITENVHEGMEWVMNGDGVATVKIDGSCCAIINGELYVRYDAKKGKNPPAGAIPCEEKPDPITGHWPHWVKADKNNPSDKWFIRAFESSKGILEDGTYEAIGPHFNGNPHGCKQDVLVPHGKHIITVERTFQRIKRFLSEHEVEGIVFWKDGVPQCKIKRRDFGFQWPVRKGGCHEHQ